MDMLTVSQVAAKLGKPPRTVRNWCMTGALPSIEVNKRLYLIEKSALDKFTEPLRGNPLFRKNHGRRKRKTA